MNEPHFRTQEVAQLYEDLRAWCHPEYPFLDPSYSPGSNIPAVDLTQMVATWLQAGRKEPVAELWGFLTGRDSASEHALSQVLNARLPSWVKLSETAQHELHAIFILTTRAMIAGHNNMARVGALLATSTVACRQFVIEPGFMPELLKIMRKFDDPDEDIEADSAAELRCETDDASEQDAKRALQEAMSPLGLVESVAERLKVVPPMVRLVVHDYLTRSWGQGTLNFSLGYGEREYGCGGKWNQYYVDWLGFFGPPSDDARVPAAVTKEILFEALEKQHVPFKASATRKALIEQARTIPGFLPALIVAIRPQQQDVRAEWKEPLKQWAKRLECTRSVGAAVFGLFALSVMPAALEFTCEGWLENLFNANVDLIYAARAATDGLDELGLDMYPAQELVGADERDEGVNWLARWTAAGGKIYQGRMIAAKCDPVWIKLSPFGHSHPPYALKTGIRVSDVTRDEALQLGIIGAGREVHAVPCPGCSNKA